MRSGLSLSAIVIASLFTCSTAHADIIVSANDAHSSLINGVGGAVKDPPPDNVTVIDVAPSPPKIVGTVDVPTSVLGPGQGVFVAKDESFAIVPAGNRAEDGKIVPDSKVSVIDLSTSPPKVVQQVTAGMGANSVAVSPAGNLVLVTNRNDGNVSAFTVKGGRLAPLATIDLGDAKSLAGGVVFAPDGKTAFVAREGAISVLEIDGESIKLDRKQVILALRPYPIDISPDGKLLAVGNSWGANGDVGSISLVDLSSKPYRVVEVARMPSVSEGLKFSPDGKYLAATSLNGSTAPTNSPRYREHALLAVFAVDGQTLTKIAEAPIGKWSQGVAFSQKGDTILAQNMSEKNISVFSFSGGKLTPQPALAIPVGAPAMIGSPQR